MSVPSRDGEPRMYAPSEGMPARGRVVRRSGFLCKRRPRGADGVVGGDTVGASKGVA